ncbi:vgr related protein [Croceicoccus estronivorus]|nr:vgr related protein [Croceicoccus estronivorus]
MKNAPFETKSAFACRAGGERSLTAGEVDLVQSVFGSALDCSSVRIRRRKWFPFQPRNRMMAPLGHIHFHPDDAFYCDDFSTASLHRQGHFIHEMTHVWQAQRHGKLHLLIRGVLSRRYSYSLRPGWPLERYGIEQQAEIVRHAFLLRNGAKLPGVADATPFDLLVNFPGGAKPG